MSRYRLRGLINRQRQLTHSQCQLLLFCLSLLSSQLPVNPELKFFRKNKYFLLLLRLVYSPIISYSRLDWMACLSFESSGVAHFVYIEMQIYEFGKPFNSHFYHLLIFCWFFSVNGIACLMIENRVYICFLASFFEENWRIKTVFIPVGPLIRRRLQSIKFEK